MSSLIARAKKALEIDKTKYRGWLPIQALSVESSRTAKLVEALIDCARVFNYTNKEYLDNDKKIAFKLIEAALDEMEIK